MTRNDPGGVQVQPSGFDKEHVPAARGVDAVRLARIAKAEEEVVRLCRGDRPGGRTFRMTVPVESTDSDIVLLDGLTAGRDALADLDRDRIELELLRRNQDNDTPGPWIQRAFEALAHAQGNAELAERAWDVLIALERGDAHGPVVSDALDILAPIVDEERRSSRARPAPEATAGQADSERGR